MKIWKIILGFFGVVGALFAAKSVKSKEVEELKVVIKENKKEVKKLEKEKKVSKKEIGNLKRKLTNSKKKTQKMQDAYDNDEVESAEDFLKKFANK